MRLPAWTGSDFFFLFVGVRRTRKRDGPEWVLLEPDGVRTSRRNIIVLSALIALAGLACANPGDLNLFGLELGTGTRGTIVLSAAVFAVQIYWYGLKYLHIRDSGEIEGRALGQMKRPLGEIRDVCLEQKGANWISNCVAVSLTVVSWVVLGYWLKEALCPSTAP